MTLKTGADPIHALVTVFRARDRPAAGVTCGLCAVLWGDGEEARPSTIRGTGCVGCRSDLL